MTNNEIVTLYNAGIATCDYAVLPPEHAYKGFKFYRAVIKAFEAFNEARTEIIKKAAGDDYETIAAGKGNDLPAERLKEIDEQAIPLIKALLAEPVEIPAVKMPFDCYLHFRASGKDVPRGVDDILEGVLFEAEEEE